MTKGKTITANGKKWSKCNGTNGDDIITVEAKGYVTVNAKKGNDKIYVNNGNWHEINGGSGNDTITVYKGSNHSIDVGSGKKDKVIIKGGNKSVIGNFTTGATGNVTIEIYNGKKHAINAGGIKKNVTVKLKGGSTSGILTWGGNDTVEVSGKGVASNTAEKYAIGYSDKKWGINTGAGNDNVTLSSNKSNGVIVYAGLGDDVITIKKGNNHIIYTEDGNDRVIISGGKGHILYLDKNSSYGKNDVMLKNTQATIDTRMYVEDNITINWKKKGLNDYAIETSLIGASGTGTLDSLTVKGLSSSEVTFTESDGRLIMSATGGSLSIGNFDQWRAWVNDSGVGIINFGNGITFDDGTLSLDQIRDKMYGW